MATKFEINLTYFLKNFKLKVKNLKAENLAKFKNMSKAKLKARNHEKSC